MLSRSLVLLSVRRLAVVALLSLAFAACGDGESGSTGVRDTQPQQDFHPFQDIQLGRDIPAPDTGSKPDTPVLLDTGSETTLDPSDAWPSGDVAPPPIEGGFGWPCASNSDCLSNWCIEDPQTGQTVCTQDCITTCPGDWECRLVNFGSSDPVSICVPPISRLCEPCATDDDCRNPADMCLPIGADPAEPMFCAKGCARTGLCPPGYTCTDILDELDELDEVIGRQCLPDTGSCVCTPSLNQTTRPCQRENEFGTCFGTQLCDGPYGWRECTAREPAVEICNGDDDNCDGEVDGGFTHVDWDGRVRRIGQSCGTGACAGGTVVCAGESEATCSSLGLATAERCNGRDDDCNGLTDDGAECPPARCDQIEGRFFQFVASECAGTAGCTEPPAVGCGLFTCAGGGAAGDVCATTCVDDSVCLPTAHCDIESGLCVADLDHGSPCTEDRECRSGHCGNGFCCASGDCCAVLADCPALYSAQPTCDDPATCQGTRVDAACHNHRCEAIVVDDDSACDTSVIADECGLFVAVRCTGASQQLPPVCPETCSRHADCDPGAHCDEVCVPNLEDGSLCDEREQCISGHCGNGFCCSDGDCCVVPDDCPDDFRRASVCDDAGTCQGTRIDATCEEFVCGSEVVSDDSGCGLGVLALQCGLFGDVYCSGSEIQTPPTCPTGCESDADCAEGAHCDGVVCVANFVDGAACDEGRQCRSGHCQNGFCCSAGDCCAVADNCPASYAQAPECVNTATCQGTRRDAVCTGHVCATSEPIPDDRGCTSDIPAITCTPYQPVFCTGSADQTPPTCPTGCAGHDDCVAGFYCSAAGVCVADLVDGQACSDSRHCASRHCQNGFCCASGDCCSQPANCPAGYRRAPSCDNETTCQGTRQDAQCPADKICVMSPPIDDDSACGADILARDCFPYPPRYCTGQANQTPPVCAATCGSDADCGGDYYCAVDQCLPKRLDGESCQQARVCLSGHCQNGFCCAAGDCCGANTDCPRVLYGISAVCESPATCQGERNDPLCTESKQCAVGPATDDDSACGPGVLAIHCAPYEPLYCTGEADQTPPACPTTCGADADCLSGYHCAGTCVANFVDGAACDEGRQCRSGHCQNGFCCSAGDCCAVADNCPASYARAPECVNTATCQGTRRDAVCTGHVCATSEPIPDDRGCTSDIRAITCTPYQPVFCTGAADQTPPTCPTGCAGHDDCVAGFHCSAARVCVADLASGQACSDSRHCASRHCQNGFCCASGDCCSQPANCPAGYRRVPTCDNETTCQGTRQDALCPADKICVMSPPIDDDSACGTDILARDCFPYLPRYCTGQVNQTPPACATSCSNHNQCQAGAHCSSSGVCTPNLAQGAGCTATVQCQSGLSCVDGVCCSSTCTGLCMRCDLPGNVGTCTPISIGQDPDNECGAISCASYYWGWSGSHCHYRADVSAAVAACNGHGACQTAAALCPSQGPGSISLTCHPTCQAPRTGTCQGTIRGACNIAGCLPGAVVATQSCGNCLQGTQNKICTSSCEIPTTWTTCVGGGECAAGSTQTAPNTSCDIRTCSQSCSWGSWAPSRIDSLEPNETKTGARFLGTIGYCDDPVQVLSANFHTATDVDWYRYDTSSEFGCLADPEIRLTVPAQAQQSYTFWVEHECKSGGDTDSKSLTVAPGTTGTLGWGYNVYRCGSSWGVPRSHEMRIWIRVRPVNQVPCSGCCAHDYVLDYRG
jgi:hypothetical protein